MLRDGWPDIGNGGTGDDMVGVVEVGDEAGFRHMYRRRTNPPMTTTLCTTP